MTQKVAGNVLDLWDQYDATADGTKGSQTEYAMDWTVNVASHDFVGSAELTSSNRCAHLATLATTRATSRYPPSISTAWGYAGTRRRRSSC